ncbi:MAG: ATP-binding protein [Sporichthyaceae bacterium]|nr:ATP-binding protein [Sporichthyaceae bacterium]
MHENHSELADTELADGSPAVDAARAVVVSVPADKTYVALIRSAASHLGARVDLTMQDLTDLRLAVDEACGLLLLPGGFETTGADLECRFAEYPDRLVVTVSAEADQSAPDVEGFGWNVLAALVDELRWSYVDGRAEVELIKRTLPAAT